MNRRIEVRMEVAELCLQQPESPLQIKEREFAKCLWDAHLAFEEKQPGEIAKEVTSFFKDHFTFGREGRRVTLTSDLLPGRNLKASFNPDNLEIVVSDKAGTESFVSRAPLKSAQRIFEREDDPGVLLFTLEDGNMARIIHTRSLASVIEHYVNEVLGE